MGPRPRSSRRARVLVPLAGVVTLAVLALVFLALMAASGAERIPRGVTIAGIDVAELKPEAANARLAAQIGEPAEEPVHVDVDERRRTLTADEAGVELDIEGAVDRAMEHGREGSFITRGWRELTGGEVEADEGLPIRIDRDSVRGFVAEIGEEFGRPVVNSELQLHLRSVSVSKPRPGRTLEDPEGLEERIVKRLRNPDRPRELAARIVPVEPTVRPGDVWRQNPVVVTVSKQDRRARVFVRGEEVKSYRVAIGDPDYPTPDGRFAVQTMEKNPTWNVPDSEWAGDLAGESIPPGDPRNPLAARWIGFDGAVGFHGTRERRSLGQAASKGCVRMQPSHVIDLYDRVEIGTLVFVG